MRGLARRRAARPTCSTSAGERRRSEKQKIVAMTMDVVNQRIGIGLQEGADLRSRNCFIMASFDGFGNAYDLVLMDGVTKKYSLNHFKLTLLTTPDDFQEDCFVTLKI